MIKVKICGLTRVKDAELACEAGADMIGVIVNASIPTPRNLDYECAREILEQVPTKIGRVAVGMPENLSEGLEIIKELDPDYLQMHSYPSLSKLKKLRELTDKKLIITLPMPRQISDTTELIMRAREIAKVSDFILLDTEGYGGGETGETHDWIASRKICDALKTPVFLAGGLTPSNVREAIDKVQPYGVDVASGTESVPGIKDPEKMKNFVRESKRL